MNPKPLRITARGRAIPQGSIRSLGAGRPSIHGNAPTLLPWRQTVQLAAETAASEANWTRATGPVSVVATYFYDRPRSHYRSGRNAHLLRDNAPSWPATRAQGDIEKLCRGAHDALTAAGIWVDDSQVASLLAVKCWTGTAPWSLPHPGAVIDVRELA